jgi:hypothetical protein
MPEIIWREDENEPGDLRGFVGNAKVADIDHKGIGYYRAYTFNGAVVLDSCSHDSIPEAQRWVNDSLFPQVCYDVDVDLTREQRRFEATRATMLLAYETVRRDEDNCNWPTQKKVVKYAVSLADALLAELEATS